jgi:succinate-acetate transporter protein
MATRATRAHEADVRAAYPSDHDLSEPEVWTQRSRVVLTPLAAPSILGLFGFFVGTIMVGTNLAGWWGNESAGTLLWPFALAAGGIAQFLAGMWAYRARDGLATAMHGIWGSFWIGYGVFELLVATHVMSPVPLAAANPAFAMWFVALAAVTVMGAFASLAESIGLFSVLGPLAAASILYAIGLFTGTVWLDRVAGWVFTASAAAAWYVASAMMIAGTRGRTVLPLGKWSADANVPLRESMRPIQFAAGEPGVRAGQ